jgi:hypothetical protein
MVCSALLLLASTLIYESAGVTPADDSHHREAGRLWGSQDDTQHREGMEAGKDDADPFLPNDVLSGAHERLTKMGKGLNEASVALSGSYSTLAEQMTQYKIALTHTIRKAHMLMDNMKTMLTEDYTALQNRNEQRVSPLNDLDSYIKKEAAAAEISKDLHGYDDEKIVVHAQVRNSVIELLKTTDKAGNDTMQANPDPGCRGECK